MRTGLRRSITRDKPHQTDAKHHHQQQQQHQQQHHHHTVADALHKVTDVLSEELALHEQAAEERRGEDGYAIYILLRHLSDFEEQDAPGADDLDHEADQQHVADALRDERLTEALAYYAQLVGSCEIINEAGELERVFFRFPDICLSLTDARKQQLEWSVDRETPGAQLLQFIQAADELHTEMVYAHQLERLWLWRFAKRHNRLADNALFALALVTNFCLVVRAQFCTERDGSPRAWSSAFCSASAQQALVAFNASVKHSSASPPITVGFFTIVGSATSVERGTMLALQVAIFVLGMLICLACVIVFVLEAMRGGWPRIRRLVLRYVNRWRLLHVSSFDEILARVRERPRRGVWFYPLCAFAFVANVHLLFLLASLIAALFALTRDPLWFAFGLLDFASKSHEIHIVAAALQQNSRSILMTIVFMVIVGYLYAVVGYRLLAKYFFYMDFSEEAIPRCTSLLQCFLTSIEDGLRFDDLGQAIERMQSPDIVEYSPQQTALYYVQSLYSLSYWFIVCIILLNVIFGIIIDSFSELRQHRHLIKGKIDNECFICGIDRFTFDTKGSGFEVHTTKEHAKWTYLFMLVMIREKPMEMYNGWEQHVAMHLSPYCSPPSAAWLPRNTALSLKEHQEREATIAIKQAAQAERTSRLIEHVASSLDAVRARQDEMDARLSRLVELSSARQQAGA